MSTLQFEVGPWPYGARKLSIAQSLIAAGLEAKPLRPTKGTADGRYWLVCAATNYKSPILQRAHLQF